MVDVMLVRVESAFSRYRPIAQNRAEINMCVCCVHATGGGTPPSIYRYTMHSQHINQSIGSDTYPVTHP